MELNFLYYSFERAFFIEDAANWVLGFFSLQFILRWESHVANKINNN